jgi:hypothetical protein
MNINQKGRKTQMTTKSHSSWARGFLAAFALVAVSGLATVTLAQDVTDQNVADRVASAKTAQDHEAIATFFKAQAATAGEKVKEHEAMLGSWKTTSGRSLNVMKQHCEDAIASFKKLQKDYAAMAAEQEKMAKKAGGK